MSTRDHLLAAIAKTISTYRFGELPVATAEHVERWTNQFTPVNQLALLQELNHMLGQYFLTKDWFVAYLRKLLWNVGLAGTSPNIYWKNTNILCIQQHGESQREFLDILRLCLLEEFNISLDECGSDGGDYIYLDDVIFSGNRIGNDLETWIREDAPDVASIHVIVAAYHIYGQYSLKVRLDRVIAETGKAIHIQYWRAGTIENRSCSKNVSELLWPASIPDEPHVANYLAKPTRFPFVPRVETGFLGPFSSVEGRNILEQEFLIAGAKIVSKSENPKTVMRPLGYSPFGVGFGSLIVTYRNCPNNCPLAIWWGDPEVTSGPLNWYPLLPRRTYSTAS